MKNDFLKYFVLFLCIGLFACGGSESSSDRVVIPVEARWLKAVNINNDGTKLVNIEYDIVSTTDTIELLHTLKVADAGLEFDIAFGNTADSLTAEDNRYELGNGKGILTVEGSRKDLNVGLLNSNLQTLDVDVCSKAKVNGTLLELGCLASITVLPEEDMSSNTYTIGGIIYNLNGTMTFELSLSTGGGAQFILTGDGSNYSTTLPNEYANGTGYTVNVVLNPSSQTCAVNNGSGTINGANVTNVEIVCTDD